MPGVGLCLKDPHEKGEPVGSIQGPRDPEPVGSIQGPHDQEEEENEVEEDISDKCLIIKS